MKKLENFSWQMWQIYALAALVVFIVGGACSFFFVKEATYVAVSYTHLDVYKRQVNISHTSEFILIVEMEFSSI